MNQMTVPDRLTLFIFVKLWLLRPAERDALDCGVRDTAFKSDAAGVAVQSAFGADNEAVDFTKMKELDGQ